MKRGQSLVIAIIALILLLEIVSAVSTTITVKTLGERKLDVVALKPDEVYTFFDSYHNTTPKDGVSTFTLETPSAFNLKIWVKENGETILNQNYEEEYSAGSPLTIELYPEWLITQKKLEAEINSRNITNLSDSNSIGNETIDSQEETTSTDELVDVDINTNTTDEKSWFTGLAVNLESFNFKSVMYVVGGLILALVIVFMVIMVAKKKSKVYSYYEKGYNVDKENKKSDEIKVRKLSEVMQQEKKSEELIEAEKKLKELQEEIEKLKNHSNREEQLKKEIIEKERELVRLRSERHQQ